VLKKQAKHNFWSDSHFYCTCHMWKTKRLFKHCRMHSSAAPVAAVCTRLWESVRCMFPFGINGIHLSVNSFLRRGMAIYAFMQLVIIFTYHSSQHVQPGSLLSHPSTQLIHIGLICIPYITWNSNWTLPHFSEGSTDEELIKLCLYSEFSHVLDLKWSAKWGSRLATCWLFKPITHLRNMNGMMTGRREFISMPPYGPHGLLQDWTWNSAMRC
jgi:hypothetical protein